MSKRTGPIQSTAGHSWDSLLLILAGLALLGQPLSARAADKLDPQAVAFFEKKIRPVLVEHCYKCHSADAAKEGKLKGGLQLDTREGLRKGGESGAAVVPGDLKKSLLLGAIQHDPKVGKMPPKSKLADEVVADFVKWIEIGAPDPRDGVVAADKYKVDFTEARQRWAFQLPKQTPAPRAGAWARTDIDRFILAKLEEKQLKPVGDAAPHVLLRRVFFDLIGLPATPLRDIGKAGTSPVPDLAINRRPVEQQQRQLALIQARNKQYAELSPEDNRIEAVIESFERGFLMQRAFPDVLNIFQERKETLALYGLDETGKGPRLAQQILLARRLVERGVRFIEIGDHAWDTHLDLQRDLPKVTGGLDQPLAGLITDLKNRGMLQDTLIIVGGEFGRTSAAEMPKDNKSGPGRDHNCKGFTWVLAGGGARGGFKYGATDDLGFAAAENKCKVHDLYATFLHLLGMDHRKMTYRYAGRDFTLPDVHGEVIKDIVG